MSVNYLLSMFAFIFVGAISPGPVNALATYSVLQSGVLRAQVYVLGASVGYTLVVVISGIALSHLAEMLEVLRKILTIGGCLFLLYLAYRLISQSSSQAQTNIPFQINGRHGFFTQVLNPKAWIFATTGIALFVTSQTNTFEALIIFCGFSFFGCMIGVGLWSMIGHWLSRWLGEHSHLKRFNYVMACLLMGTVFSLLYSLTTQIHD